MKLSQTCLFATIITALLAIACGSSYAQTNTNKGKRLRSRSLISYDRVNHPPERKRYEYLVDSVVSRIDKWHPVQLLEKNESFPIGHLATGSDKGNTVGMVLHTVVEAEHGSGNQKSLSKLDDLGEKGRKNAREWVDRYEPLIKPLRPLADTDLTFKDVYLKDFFNPYRLPDVSGNSASAVDPLPIISAVKPDLIPWSDVVVSASLDKDGRLGGVGGLDLKSKAAVDYKSFPIKTLIISNQHKKIEQGLLDHLKLGNDRLAEITPIKDPKLEIYYARDMLQVYFKALSPRFAGSYVDDFKAAVTNSTSPESAFQLLRKVPEPYRIFAWYGIKEEIRDAIVLARAQTDNRPNEDALHNLFAINQNHIKQMGLGDPAALSLSEEALDQIWESLSVRSASALFIDNRHLHFLTKDKKLSELSKSGIKGNFLVIKEDKSYGYLPITRSLWNFFPNKSSIKQHPAGWFFTS